MKVLILEDVIEHQVRLERILDEISKESNIPISYKTTGKVREFEEYIENDEVNQLYFLDIDIHGIEKKGFEVAQLIRHYNPYAIIVFITSRSEFATLTYKYQVSALDFVDKDINDEMFKKRIEQNIFYTKSMLLENEDVVDYFDYNYKGNDLKIPYHDILYIETTGVSHKLRIIGKNFAKEFYGTMTDIQEKDKHTQRFYSPHKSFLVNIGNIREIDRKNLEIVFYEDHRCPTLTSEQQTEISDSVSQNLTASIQSAQSIVALVQDLQGSLENLQNQSSNLSTLKNQSNQVSPITSTSLIGLSSGLTEIQGDVTSKLVPASQSIASGVNAYTTGVDKVSQDVIQRAVGLG